MKINLTQPEIEQAIKDYLKNYISMPGCDFRIEMSATRGAAGFIAEVTVCKAEEVHTLTPKQLEKPIPEVNTETGEVEQPKRQSLFSGLK